MNRLRSVTLSIFMSLLLFTGCQTIKTDKGQENNSQQVTSQENQNSNDGNNNSNGEVKWDKNLLDPQDPVTVKFYSYSAANPAYGTGFETLKNNFNEGIGKEKGVKVEYVMDDNNGTKVKADVKAGQEVDIIQGSFSNLGVYKEDLGLNSYEETFPKEEMEKAFKGIPEKVLKLGVLDDKTYSIPFTISTPMMYVNKDIVKKAGLDPEKPPKSFEEMYEMSKTIKEKTGKYGLAFSETNSSGWITASVLKSNGADVLSEDGKAVLFNSPESEEAFSIWRKFYADKVGLGGSDAEVVQAFQTGEAAFMINSTSVYESIKASFEKANMNLNGFPMPGLKGKDSIPTNSGAGLVIKAKDEKKAQAIWEVIKYYTSDEGFNTVTSEIGYLPLRPELANDEKYLKDYVEKNPMIKRNIERLGDIEKGPIWTGNRAAEAKQAYIDMQTKILTSQEDINPILEQYEKLINDMLK